VLNSVINEPLDTLNESKRSSSNLDARDSKLEKMESDNVLKQ
jgi:hypothetical protein